MTSIDTIEFTTNTDFIKSVDSNKFIVTNISKPNGLKFTNYSLNNKPMGINKISINDLNNTIRINASSKILGMNYNKGINNNTLDQFINEINKTGIELDQDFIYDCSVNKTDVKNDINLTNDINDYLNTLNQLTAPKFYKTKYDTGIVFNEKIISQPIRLTGYSKKDEIKQASKKDLYKMFPQLIYLLNDTMRIESRLPTKATVKKYFKSNNLIDILNTSLINYQILNKIIDSQTNFKPLVNTYNMTNTQEKNYAQIYYLNEYYNGDFNSIMNHIKSKLSKRTKATYQRNIVLENLAMINNSDDNFLNNIEEIKRKLKE